MADRLSDYGWVVYYDHEFELTYSWRGNLVRNTKDGKFGLWRPNSQDMPSMHNSLSDAMAAAGWLPEMQTRTALGAGTLAPTAPPADKPA